MAKLSVHHTYMQSHAQCMWPVHCKLVMQGWGLTSTDFLVPTLMKWNCTQILNNLFPNGNMRNKRRDLKTRWQNHEKGSTTMILEMPHILRPIEGWRTNKTIQTIHQSLKNKMQAWKVLSVTASQFLDFSWQKDSKAHIGILIHNWAVVSPWLLAPPPFWKE